MFLELILSLLQLEANISAVRQLIRGHSGVVALPCSQALAGYKLIFCAFFAVLKLGPRVTAKYDPKHTKVANKGQKMFVPVTHELPNVLQQKQPIGVALGR